MERGERAERAEPDGHGGRPRRTVDRGLARMIALKRIFTGVTALVAALVCVGVGLAHGGAPPAQLLLAITIFLGGGAWSLRDGLRLKRELDGR